MASPASHGGNSSSDFDMRQSEEMWKNFNRLAKWMVIGTIIVLALMAFFLTGDHPQPL